MSFCPVLFGQAVTKLRFKGRAQTSPLDEKNMEELGVGACFKIAVASETWGEVCWGVISKKGFFAPQKRHGLN